MLIQESLYNDRAGYDYDGIYDDIDYQESGDYYDHFLDAWSSYYEYLADALHQQLVNQLNH